MFERAESNLLGLESSRAELDRYESTCVRARAFRKARKFRVFELYRVLESFES